MVVRVPSWWKVGAVEGEQGGVCARLTLVSLQSSTRSQKLTPSTLYLHLWSGPLQQLNWSPPFLSLVDDILQATWLGKLVFFLWMPIILLPFPNIKNRWGGGKMAQQIRVLITRHDLDFILEAHRGQKEPIPQSCPLASPYSYTLNK